MKKLLKGYELTTNEQYYDMCIESLINGQRAQARMQFNKLPKENKKDLLNYIKQNHEPSADIYKFFFDEL